MADELRAETINAVAVTGGHLGAGLGVVELTVALHYVFDTPRDRLVWDVGHQAYPHKILTGRRDRIRTLRQGGGLSGFTKRAESEYDPFGAAHSSTSISAGLGMAVARDLAGEPHNVICVIGDGAMSAGMAYEAMNNAGAMNSRLIVILNDNDMSIAPPVGAMSAYLARLVSGRTYRSLRDIVQAARQAPAEVPGAARAARRRNMRAASSTGGTLFEELGFYYVGPIDGHNLDHLLPVLKNVRDAKTGPILVHVVTAEGQRLRAGGSVRRQVSRRRQVRRRDRQAGQGQVQRAVLHQGVRREPDQGSRRRTTRSSASPRRCRPAPGSTCSARRFPDRTFDVGIAEQHAVTFAAGLATEGYKPFCAIYSTFLQRAYDQVVHDVAIQRLPVRFAIDRAGLVGADGPTHAGSFDLAYLGCLPGFVLMAAADEAELVHMVATAVAIDDRPSALRYPRGDGVGVDMPEFGVPLEIGKGRIVREGTTVALLSLGTRLAECLKAAETLASARPVDHGRRRALRQAARHRPGAAACARARGADHHRGRRDRRLRRAGAADARRARRARSRAEGALDGAARPLHRPGQPAAMYAKAGLDANAIVAKVFEALGKDVRVRIPTARIPGTRP